MVSVKGSIGARVMTRSYKTASFVNGTTRIVRITPKLLARSARDWMSPLPTIGSSAATPPRSHLWSNSRT